MADRLKVHAASTREGDEIPAGHILVVRVIMRPAGWTVDVDSSFAEMLQSETDGKRVGETLIEAVTKSIRLHTGK